MEKLTYGQKIEEFNNLIADPSFKKAFLESQELQQLLLNTSAKVLDLTKVEEPPLNEIGLPMTPLEAEVYEMVERGKKGLPPKYPYFHKEWDSVIDFIKEKYGKYLSSCNGGEEDALYLDQLGIIHPLNEEKIRIKRKILRLEKSKNPNKYFLIKTLQERIDYISSRSFKNKYGDDVRQAIINYYNQGSKITGSYKELIKAKQDRLNKYQDLSYKTDTTPYKLKEASNLLSKYYYLKNR